MTNNKTTYRRLGDYIREVDVRNTDLRCSNLLGLSNAKVFIPSIANTIGTDLRSYKIVRQSQFAYVPVTSRNGDKITVALYNEEQDCIVSQAYLVFEVINHEKLLPEYLMMWFRRPEFDRYSRFKSHGSAREVFEWDEMCDVMLPVPSIEEQRRIVTRYQAIQNRIENNKKTIAKLEEAAQALYRKMFVDGIDVERLPEGWRMGRISDLGEIVTGKTPSTFDETNFGYDMPFVTIPDMHDVVFVTETERSLSTQGATSQKNKTIPANSICVSCIGTPGLVVINKQPVQTNQQINSVVLTDKNALYYSYFALSNMKQIIAEYGMGGAVLNNLNKDDFSKLQILLPDAESLEYYDAKVSGVFDLLCQYQKENRLLTEMLSVVMAWIR